MLGLGLGLTSPASIGGAAAGGTWTPLDLGAALKYWANADDHGTANMTDDGGGLISQWKDRVGGLAATGATTARPTWTATAFNSAYAGVTGNGTANILKTAVLTGLPTGATGGEIWLLLNSTSVVANSFMFMYGAAGGVSRTLYHTATPQLALSDGTTNTTQTTPATLLGNLIIGAFWAGTTQSARVNGADASPAGTIGALNTPTSGSLSMFARNTSLLFAAMVLRHGIVTTTLTALQRQQMEGYLGWDAGLAGSTLAVGHPYKSARP